MEIYSFSMHKYKRQNRMITERLNAQFYIGTDKKC